MTRLKSTINCLAASALFTCVAGAADPSIQNLNSRIIAIETRLATIEEALRGETSSHQYQEQATLEATNGVSQNPTIETSIEQTTYVIKDGDTLGSIAREHKVERADLLSANRLSEGQPIYIGETLVIPGAAETVSIPEPKKEKVVGADTKPAPANEKSVVVGETPKPTNSKTYTVVSGDTLTRIAKKNGTDVATLKSANGLRSDSLAVGQVLNLPTPGVQNAVQTTGPQEPQYEYDNPLLRNSETYGHYTVRKGDNLYALARDFFSSMAELQRLNRLGDSTLIYPGDELIVPTSKYNAYHNSSGVAQR